ncbi:ABC transporter permease [Nocardioides alcanivorans]|uniref:ABC transporter permease n=1 Tax=Nocardioides alcanivorans TaxID=2897352 RepID=UPI001F3B6DFC|nr:hypothetical protein [Nocardioides alcanivorans]
MTDTELSPRQPADQEQAPSTRGVVGADAGAARLLGSLRASTGPAVEQVVMFVVFLACGVLAGLLLGGLTGHSPSVIWSTLVQGSVGDATSIAFTLTAAAPLLLVATGTVICMRAGQFNIGQEGQVTLGAIGAGFVVFKIDASTSLLIPLAFVAAMVAGALWAALAAVLKFSRGVDIVVTSLLLVFLAEQLLVALISGNGPLHDSGDGVLGAGTASQSPPVPDAAILGGIRMFGVDVPIGFVIALVVAVLVAWFLRSSVPGYRLRILGESPAVARTLGVRESRTGTWAVMASGALAGAAGSVVLLGQSFQIHGNFASAIGWNGLLIALAARLNTGISILLALVFGAMTAGGGLLGGQGVPTDLVNVMTAAVIVALLCPPVALAALRRRRQRRKVEAA